MDPKNTSIGNSYFRQFAIDLLDDEDGVNIKALASLDYLLRKTDNEDVAEAVEVQCERGFINEDQAEELRKKT